MKIYLTLAAILLAAMLVNCSSAPGERPNAARPTRNGTEHARPVQPNLDEGIATGLEAAFLGNNLHVRYQVSERIVTLIGDVNSQAKRARAERVAAAVVNVQQVINELRVRPRQFEKAGKKR